MCACSPVAQPVRIRVVAFVITWAVPMTMAMNSETSHICWIFGQSVTPGALVTFAPFHVHSRALDFPGLRCYPKFRVLAGRSSVSARAVDVAIHRLRAMNAEIEDVDPAHWLPEHTLYVYVDPLLRALGWEPSDPEECRRR